VRRVVIHKENGEVKEIKIKNLIYPNCETCVLWETRASRSCDFDHCEDFIPYDKGGCVFIDGKWWSE